MAVQSGRHDRTQPVTAGQATSEVSLTTASTPAFVGRDGELGAVVGALEIPPALVLVEGEAGIGKTRLLHECLQAPSLTVRSVLLTACAPLPEPFPLGGIVDGLRRLRPRLGEVGLSALGGALRPLFPEWMDVLPPALESLDDANETRRLIYAALTELVERLGVEVLVVEDAHWADTATLEWLLSMCASGDQKVSIVVSYRPHDVAEGSLLRRLTSRPSAGRQVRVVLGSLDLEQSRRLVGSMLGTEEVSEKFAAFLCEHTDGLPLALEESVRLMRERHDIIRQDGLWTRRVLSELDVPPTVRDSVLERVDRLGSGACAVLRAAAVLAEPADQQLLIAVADLDEDAGKHGVARGLAAGLLRDAGGGQLAFRHLLDSKAVEDAIPASERWALHRRAAYALQRFSPQPVARLARHFHEANDVESWCHYAEVTADRAWESGGDRVATVTLLDVLSTAAHPAERAARLASKLGEVALNGTAAFGVPDQRVEEVLRNVLARDDLQPADRGEITLWLGSRALQNVSETRQLASEEIEAAIPDLRHRPDLACRAMSLLAMPLTQDWPAQRHLDWLAAATELSSQITSRQERQWFSAMRACALLLLGEEAGWDAAAELSDSGVTRGEKRVALVGMQNIAQCAILWGRYDDARKWLEKALEITGGFRPQRNYGLVARAYLNWYTGNWDGLLDSATALVDIEESDRSPKFEALQLVGLLEQAGGARSRAERRLREVTDADHRFGPAEPFMTLAPTALARLCLADGAPDEALGLTGPVIEMITRKGMWLLATDIALVHLDALIDAGRVPEAEALVGQFADGVSGRRAPAPTAALITCRGIVAQDDPARAAELFGQAAVAWAALPRPYDELLALERRGRCLLAVGQLELGLSVLAEVEQRLRRLGATWDSDRVAHVLREHGVEIVRTWRRGRRGYGDQLSPREREVVELAARGMTNKQIADSLFITISTVKRHMQAAMGKLGVSSRTALAMAAAEAGLLSTDADAN